MLTKTIVFGIMFLVKAVITVKLMKKFNINFNSFNFV